MYQGCAFADLFIFEEEESWSQHEKLVVIVAKMYDKFLERYDYLQTKDSYFSLFMTLLPECGLDAPPEEFRWYRFSQIQQFCRLLLQCHVPIAVHMIEGNTCTMVCGYMSSNRKLETQMAHVHQMGFMRYLCTPDLESIEPNKLDMKRFSHKIHCFAVMPKLSERFYYSLAAGVLKAKSKKCQDEATRAAQLNPTTLFCSLLNELTSPGSLLCDKYKPPETTAKNADPKTNYLYSRNF